MLDKEKRKHYKNKRKTQEEFEKEVYDLVGQEYTVIGEYVTGKTDIIMRHNICNREYPVKPRNFLYNKNRCPLCNHDKRKIAYKGDNNLNYKSGSDITYSLSKHLRHYIVDWRKNIMRESYYTCYISGQKGGKLQVHHLYNYNQIMLDVLKELHLELKGIFKYSETEMINIENLFADKHVKNLGVCLSKDVHLLFHHTYGNKNNSIEQFEEFEKRYSSGEFINEIEKIKNKITLNLQKAKQEKKNKKMKVVKLKIKKPKEIKIKLEKVNGQEMKRCSKCKEIFPSTKEYFYGDKNKTDGLVSACKKCDRNTNKKPRKPKYKPKRARGEATKGIKNPNAKLTEKDVLEIVFMLLNGIKHTEIVKNYNIGTDIISHIKSGRRWGHLLDEDTKNKLLKLKCKKLNEQLVREIKILLIKGEKVKMIADLYDISEGSIYDIKNNRSWKNVVITEKDLKEVG